MMPLARWAFCQRTRLFHRTARMFLQIGGLAEKQYGGTSGWMYSVNGNNVL